MRIGRRVNLIHPKSGAVGNVIGTGSPIRFSGSRVGFDKPAPAVGEYNQEIYGGLIGYSEERIRELQENEFIQAKAGSEGP